MLWLANPYLALLLVPAAHVWLLAAGRPRRRGRAVRALRDGRRLGAGDRRGRRVAGALELGAAAPWTLTLMVADGQIGLGVTLPFCFLAGAPWPARSYCLCAAARCPAPLEARPHTRGGADPTSNDR